MAKIKIGKWVIESPSTEIASTRKRHTKNVGIKHYCNPKYTGAEYGFPWLSTNIKAEVCVYCKTEIPKEILMFAEILSFGD